MIATATDLLYLLCSLALIVSAAFVLLGGRHTKTTANSGTSTRWWFAMLAGSLLGWVGTLYAFDHYQAFHLSAETVLLVGRANFASVAIAVYFALRFVRSLAGGEATDTPDRVPLLRLLLLESVVMGLLSVGTAFVGKSEMITSVSPDGTLISLLRPATTYGALFPIYVLHVFSYLAATVFIALSARKEAPRPRRDQLGLVALGVMATGGIGLVTNAALPYFFGNFRYTDVRTLSTLLFLVAVGWAVARHRLFNLRVFLRKTLVYGMLLSLVAAVYSAVVLTLTVWLSEGRTSGLAQFAVIALAGAFDPLKRFLDEQIDRLLFMKKGSK